MVERCCSDDVYLYGASGGVRHVSKDAVPRDSITTCVFCGKELCCFMFGPDSDHMCAHCGDAFGRLVKESFGIKFNSVE